MLVQEATQPEPTLRSSQRTAAKQRLQYAEESSDDADPSAGIRSVLQSHCFLTPDSFCQACASGGDRP